MIFSRTLQYFRQTHVLIFVGLVAVSLIQAFIMSKTSLAVGAILVTMIVGLPVVVLLVASPRIGFYIVLVLSFLISFIQRITDQLVPVMVLEVMLALSWFGLIIQQVRTPKNGTNWSYYSHPIALTLLIVTFYTHIQFFNPNSSSILGKFIAIRLSWYNLIGFAMALHVFRSIKEIKLFFKIVLVICMLAALHGLSQKYIGLFPREREWLFSSPLRVQLFVIWGRVRSWAFLNDPGNYGILMATGAVLSFAFMVGPRKTGMKVLLGASCAAMLLAMVTSGTRTAFVMVPVGLGLFALLTVTQVRTIVISLSVFLVFLGIYFGPFYSAPIMRIRSAFQGDEDPSMNVRTQNKDRIRPYLLSHPIGGGPNTTGDLGRLNEPGHPLAGFPPDSGYLRVALETGIVGLLLVLALHYTAVSRGVREYFRVTDPDKRNIYLAIVCSLLALCLADLTQLSSAVKPFDFIYFAFFGMLIKLEKL